MAIGPHSAKEILDAAVRPELMKMVEDGINTKLADPEFLRQFEDNDGHFKPIHFTFQGTATTGEKEAIRQLYQHAGWSQVRVTNSGETDPERPNIMFGVRLFETPET